MFVSSISKGISKMEGLEKDSFPSPREVTRQKVQTFSCKVSPWDIMHSTVTIYFCFIEYWSGLSSLLQGIFPTQGSNPGLMHCGQIPYKLSHQVSPRILEWVAFPFSSRSSQSRNQIGVSCIEGRFFTS